MKGDAAATGRVKQSDFIVYVDESGDHGPTSAQYPIFVLAFCIFSKKAYLTHVAGSIRELKFKYFGHDGFPLHEREIRKATGPFSILRSEETRGLFMSDVAGVIHAAPFTLVAAAIRKDKLRAQYRQPEDPYHLGVCFGLERIAMHLAGLEDDGRLHVVFESRGANEDRALELEFRRVCDSNRLGRKLDMEPVFASKHGCHAGLEIADMVARPIGQKLLNPTKENRAYEVIEPKFRRSASGTVLGYGLKCFP